MLLPVESSLATHREPHGCMAFTTGSEQSSARPAMITFPAWSAVTRGDERRETSTVSEYTSDGAAASVSGVNRSNSRHSMHVGPSIPYLLDCKCHRRGVILP